MFESSYIGWMEGSLNTARYAVHNQPSFMYKNMIYEILSWKPTRIQCMWLDWWALWRFAWYTKTIFSFLLWDCSPAWAAKDTLMPSRVFSDQKAVYVTVWHITGYMRDLCAQRLTYFGQSNSDWVSPAVRAWCKCKAGRSDVQISLIIPFPLVRC